MSDKTNKINNESRSKYGTLTSFVGIGTNLFLSALKLTIGFITNSVAIMADALNNLSDAGSSIISLISFKLSSRPADKEHPFGHARIEYIASMIVSFLILIVGFEMFSDSLSVIFGFSEAKVPSFSTISIIIIGISVVVKLFLAIFYRIMGKKINSSVILASSTDSFFDCVSTVAVLASSIVIKLTDVVIIDAIVGLLVSLLILYAGIKTLNETKNSLLGEGPVKETVDAITAIVKEYPEIIGMHDLIVHNYGPGHYVASLHAEVDGKDDIYVLHDVIDNVEKRIGSELNILCTIHLDPITTDDEIVNILKGEVVDCVKFIDERIGVHDFRVVVGVTHTNLIFDLEVPFDIKTPIEKISSEVEAGVKQKRPECFCLITVDRI